MDPIPGVKKIAVLRAVAVGDYIVALPALEALRLAYPDADIALLAKPWNKGFLENRKSPVDRVIVIPPSRGVRVEPGMQEDAVELDRFFTQMQAEEFDLAIQLHGGGTSSNPFVLRLGAQLAVGMKSPQAVELDRWHPYEIYQPEIIRYLETVALVGAPMVTLQPRLEVTAPDLEEARRFTAGISGPFITIHPGASDMRRRWSPAKFAYVADTLAAETGATIVLTGIGAEKEAVEAVVSRMRGPAINLCGQLTLGGLVGVLSQAQLLICNDTGPSHVARAVGTPTVTICWGPNATNWGPLFRKDHRIVLSWTIACPICGWCCPNDYPFNAHNGCEHLVSFVDAANSDEVLAASRDLLRTTAFVLQ